MIFIVQSQNNLQKIASLNISFSYSISKGCAVKFRPFTSSALNRSIARWLGRYSPQGSRPRGGPRLAALMVQDLYLPQVRKKSTKSEMNHRISLKLCTQVKEKILRTFSYWHFSEKKVLHGFFWVFLVFSHLSHL